MTSRALRLFSIALFVCLFAMHGEAQTCARATSVQRELKVEHSSCKKLTSSGYRCDPDALLRLTVPVTTENPTLPICDGVQWTFDDGSPVVTTAEAFVDHQYVAGDRYAVTQVTSANGPRQSLARIVSAYGAFWVDYIPSPIAESQPALTVRISRDDSRFAASVDYAVTEALGPHRIVPTSGTLAFAAGETQKTFDVTILNDDVWRAEQTRVHISLSNATGGYRLWTTGAAIFVSDDDLTTTHQYTASSYQTSEVAGSVAIEIARGGRTDVASIARILVRDSTWPETQKQISFAPGDVRKTITLQVFTDDAYYTGNRSSSIELQGQVNGGDWAQGGVTTVEVADDEPFPVLAGSLEVTEGDADQAIAIPISVTPPFGYAKQVFVSLQNGTHGYGDLSVAGAFSLDAGMATTFLQGTVGGDQLIEPDETFTITLQYGSSSQGTATVLIHDDDALPYAYVFNNSSHTAEESAGVAIIKIRRTGDVSSQSQATLRIVPQVVESAWKPWQATSMPITFEAGVTSIDVRVPLPVDDLYNPARTAELQIIVLDQILERATLTLLDDDIPSLIVNDFVLDETTPTASQWFRVFLSEYVNVPVTVHVKSADGTARAGADYFAIDGDYQIRASSDNVVVGFRVNQDNEAEADETFTIHVTTCCGSPIPLATTATFTIRGTLPAAPSYRFAASTARSVAESAGSAKLTVERSGDASAAVTLQIRDEQYDINGPSIQSPALAPATVSFLAGETSKDVFLPIDDKFWSGSRIRHLQLLQGANVVHALDLIILEDEAVPAFTLAPGRATESPSGVTMPFQLSIAPAFSASLRVVLSPESGSARAGSDFDAQPQEITLPAYTTSAALSVLVLDDAESESDETFTAVLTIRRPDGTTQRVEAAGTIVDDDGWLLTPNGTVLPIGKFDMRLTAPGPVPQSVSIPVVSSNSAIVSVPPVVTIAAGRREVTFTAEALRRGSVVITATLPSSASARTLESPLTVYELVSPVATPNPLRVTAGSSAMLSLALQPASLDVVHATLTSSDASIVAIDPVVTVAPGGTAKIQVRGIKQGKATIEIVLPVDVGGQRVSIPVEVGPAVTKRRGVRH